MFVCVCVYVCVCVCSPWRIFFDGCFKTVIMRMTFCIIFYSKGDDFVVKLVEDH